MGRATNSAVQSMANRAEPTGTPYVGDIMLQCIVRPDDFRHTSAVIVSGDGKNVCGHALLHIGRGWYFHVAGTHDRPRCMRENGFKRYLQETGKQEIRRSVVHIPDPHGAHRKLDELLSRQWLWGGLVHNCVTFVEVIAQAGGSRAGMYLNCPTAERFAP